MRFVVKTFQVPITRDKQGKCSYQEVALTDDILKNIEKTKIDSTVKISMEAVNISGYNKSQLVLAENFNLDHAKKKVMAKID